MTRQHRPVPWILWPIKVVWDLLTFILRLSGRFVGALFGLVLMIIGFVLTVVVILAPVGIPLIILGFLLLLRSLF